MLVIGFFTFALSVTGYFIGHKAGSFIKSKIEIIGGIILIGLGAKILIKHLL
ncbi:MAG: manganese efflux pump [Actinobacteria bacterium]|nr:manganese efflux pump [Actinomycetota bacterium]